MDRLFQLLSNTYFRSLVATSTDNYYYNQMMQILAEFDRRWHGMAELSASDVDLVDFLKRHERVIMDFEDSECITKH